MEQRGEPAAFVEGMLGWLFFCISCVVRARVNEEKSETRSNVPYIEGITVYGSIIVNHLDHRTQDDNVTLYRGPWTTVATNKDIHQARMQNIEILSTQLPFPLHHYPAMFTRPCSRNEATTRIKYERGLSYAHYQIWQDFIFFDDDFEVLKASLFQEQKSNSFWQADVDIFQIKNGTRIKNGVVMNENDILVVFEDDAEVAIVDHAAVLKTALTTMSRTQSSTNLQSPATDALYLGWCDAKIFGKYPICTHAYALSRRGAKKLMDHFNPCGLALDLQMAIACKSERLTCNKVESRLIKKFVAKYPRKGDRSKGIFHQADIHGVFFP